MGLSHLNSRFLFTPLINLLYSSSKGAVLKTCQNQCTRNFGIGRQCFSTEGLRKNEGNSRAKASVFSLAGLKKVIFPMKSAGDIALQKDIQQKSLRLNSFQLGASQAPKKGLPFTTKGPAASNAAAAGGATRQGIMSDLKLSWPGNLPVSKTPKTAMVPELRVSANPHFVPIQDEGEKVSILLFKISMIAFTIPYAITFIVRHMMVSTCVQGFESTRPASVRRTLKRVRSVVCANFLASWFESDEGVLAMMNVFRRGMDERTLEQWIITCRHLLRYPATRDALTKNSLLDALDSALHWAPDDLRPFLLDLQLEAAAAARGETVGENSGAPTAAAAVSQLE